MRRALFVIAMVIVGAVVAWVLFVGLPRWTADRQTRAAAQAPAPAAAAPSEPARRIRAHLFVLSEDAQALRSADAEVLYGESTAEQARHLVEALIEAPAAPLRPPLPNGTRVRGVYVGSDRVAYVDLSGESRLQNTGALGEILTVYSVVDTVVDNLPAITAVQILVDGREVDTLSGHVDLRRPLSKNLRWAETAATPAPGD